ncbi:MAG: hypothetical protein O3A95_00610 [Planctomycetota bacterium]|nr:hypothetical protein [Planctomycetota bacterium]MDA1112792.1 hypothetical protein [Planctomycetota bacterium]
MRPILFLLATFFLLGTAASAQVYALEFRDGTAAKQYKKQIYHWNGMDVLLVELGDGISRDFEGDFDWLADDVLEFYLQDQGDPSMVPYSIDERQHRVVREKKFTISMAGDQVERLHPFMPTESFYTLAKAHALTLAEIAELERAIQQAKGDGVTQTALQHALHRRLMNQQIWYRHTGYLEAAEDLEKPLKKLRHILKLPIKAKAREAAYLISTPETPEKLVDAAHAVGGPNLEFHVQESTHLRILYHTGISDADIEELLRLGEHVIADFRTRSIEPMLERGKLDPVPEEVFLELFFSTDQKMHQEKLLGSYYGLEWGDKPGDPARARNRGTHFQLPDRDLSYWRVLADVDIAGVLLHRLGHSLATRCYNIQKDKLDWMEEGLGYELTMRYLNRSSGHCVSFKEEADEDYEKVVTEGLAQKLAQVSLDSKTQIPDLCGRQLYVFENTDLAKAWSTMAWLDREAGVEGQIWMREVQQLMLSRNFLKDWRKLTTNLFGLQGGDSIYQLEEDLWRPWLSSTYAAE